MRRISEIAGEARTSLMRRTAERKERASSAAIRDAESIANWYAGSVNYLPPDARYDVHGGTRLRFLPDEGRVEDAQYSFKIPVRDFMAAYKLAEEVRRSGIKWEGHVPVYAQHIILKRIWPNGDARCWCEFWSCAETSRVAREIRASGWIDAAPSVAECDDKYNTVANIERELDKRAACEGARRAQAGAR
jgi:hypothetical protein